MKLEFQAKYLQYLLNKNENQGFSWVDLLYVIIILGILAAIVLPGLLSQVNKAEQAEAKNIIGAINRSQQAYFLEYQKFTTDFAQLRLEIKTETTNYGYRIELVPQKYVMNIAQAKKSGFISYVGIVGTTTGNSITSEVLTIAFACTSDEPTTKPPLIPTEYEAYLGCPKGYHDLCWRGKGK